MSKLQSNTYLNDVWGDISQVHESSSKIPQGDYTGVVLSTIEGPIMSYKELTRNERHYPKELCELIINSDYVREMISTKSFLGEPDHPEDDRLSIHLPNVSHSIRDIKDDPSKGCYRAVIDILDTPSGRILETLRRYGTKLGISSRGSGRVIDVGGTPTVEMDSYVFSTFDIVHNPGNECARLHTVDILDESHLNGDSYIEEVPSNNYGSMLDEIITESQYYENKEDLYALKSVVKTLPVDQDYYLSKLDEVISSSESSKLVENLTSELTKKSAEVDNLSESLSNLLNSGYYTQDDLDNLNSQIETIREDNEKLISAKLSLESRSLRLHESKLTLASKYESDLHEKSERISDLESKVESYESMKSEYIDFRCTQLRVPKYLVESYLHEDMSIEEVDAIISKVYDDRESTYLMTESSTSQVVGQVVRPSDSTTILIESLKSGRLK